jgi:hypothetical protein
VVILITVHLDLKFFPLPKRIFKNCCQFFYTRMFWKRDYNRGTVTSTDSKLLALLLSGTRPQVLWGKKVDILVGLGFLTCPTKTHWNAFSPKSKTVCNTNFSLWIMILLVCESRKCETNKSRDSQIASFTIYHIFPSSCLRNTLQISRFTAKLQNPRKLRSRSVALLCHTAVAFF